jgi:hypothetical protein
MLMQHGITSEYLGPAGLVNMGTLIMDGVTHRIQKMAGR